MWVILKPVAASLLTNHRVILTGLMPVVNSLAAYTRAESKKWSSASMSKYLLIAVLALGIVLGAGFQETRIQSLKAEHAQVLRDLAIKTAEAQQALLVYEREVNTAFTTIRNQTHETLTVLQNQLKDSESARTALLSRLRKLSATPSNSATTSKVGQHKSSVKDSATFNLFVELLDRHSRELQEVGEYADRLRAAGLSCERSFDAIPTYKSPQQ